MSGMKCRAALVGGALLLVSGFSAQAVDAKSAPGKPMNRDEPMPIKMAKPGMKKGAVKVAAEKKEREMKPMLERESAGRAKKQRSCRFSRRLIP